MQMVEMKIKIYGLLSVQKEGEEDGKISDESKGEDGDIYVTNLYVMWDLIKNLTVLFKDNQI